MQDGAGALPEFVDVAEDGEELLHEGILESPTRSQVAVERSCLLASAVLGSSKRQCTRVCVCVKLVFFMAFCFFIYHAGTHLH